VIDLLNFYNLYTLRETNKNIVLEWGAFTV